MRHILLIGLIFTSSFIGYAQNIIINGLIIDFETKEPIEFVNIGILNKNKGTVSNQNGEFNLEVSKEYIKDSLTISHINYYPSKIPIVNAKNKTVFLKPKMNELSEVIVSNKKKKNRKIGVKSYNPLLWLGGISEDNDIIENAQRINIPEKIVRIKYVNIYLRRGFESDSSFVRINFYKNVDNMPGERIVFENILQKKQIKPGWLQIDLTKKEIYVEEDFFVGVEFIPDFKNPLNVYIGAILTKGKGYSRRNSQGKWNKLQGASTINVEIEY
ncbi:carboxypeptidase-like regulatory domain-containing protein [Flavivirga aquimarina]|uniref:Carboxypeptidase-like regulatory domain-containing protein n=1 Tax=Flavivirga aquimarina TaxID=2027862 RepID=A0ABT8WFX9_9FLAO|nr:carboxypeptidase-like regulatory domain-containing protein [Flavivirga aquimarina]MDO5972055.1 carboxypeptidase-like regulatory domain-containing protein [Flavivirga aquimarina]